MTRDIETDLVIIGGGPAGLSTALHLVQRDQTWRERLVVIEKEKYPRHKLCGGGITRPGLRTLQELDIQLPLPLPQVPVDHVLLKYRHRVIHVRGQPLFVVVYRPAFDDYLAQQTRKRGIQIHEDEEVLALERHPDHVRVTTSRGCYQAKAVVGADGVSGIVRRVLRNPSSNPRIARTLEGWTPQDQVAFRLDEGQAFFDFTPVNVNLQGYFWIFPNLVRNNPGYNAGVYDSRMVTARVRARLPEILNQGLDDAGIDSGLLPVEGAPIRWFHPDNPIASHRVLLVGDAAGVDVLFGEGISPALGFGKIASLELEKAFRKDDFRFDQYHRNFLLSSVGRYLLIRYLVGGYLYHLGHQAVFTHALWTVGKFLARIWRPDSL